MTGISSRSAGVLLLPEAGTGEYAVFDVVAGEKQDPVEAKYLYSAVQDWEEVEGTDADALVKATSHEYWLERIASLLRLVIGGLDGPLERRVLEHVEETLGSRVSSEETLDRLLVAPLADPHSPLAPGKSALSSGFSAVASILDELAELQPRLHRLTDLWLGLSETAFSHFSESKQMIWLTVVERLGVKQLLEAANRNEFTAKWNLLAFHLRTPQSKSGVSILGQEVSGRLFPSIGQEEKKTAPQAAEAEPTARNARNEGKRAVGKHRAFRRVEKQIDAIAQAVSEGHDAIAERFLRDLIQQQTSVAGGKVYAVKSLCNIAQQCADMFRMDFEALCLGEARRLAPADAWALVQYGDHLKRVGDYDKAIEVFGQAERLGESVVAKSCVADVFSQQGDYPKAILTYEGIPNFRDYPLVRTAIADNLRKVGRMDEAEAAYEELIQLAQGGLPDFATCAIRGQVGMAEIAKRQGRLEDALRSYREILTQEEVDDRDRLFHKLGLCNVLKLMGKFDEAYRVVEGIIGDYPFSMQARFTRGSILGLMGLEEKGLEDLPESSGCRSWREWLRHYYRGLLLLKLEKYEDAKRNLVDELSTAIASGEERAILRMGAALWYLSRDETAEADEILSTMPDLYDCHTRYLSLVLKLHSATRRDDLAVINSLRKQIAELRIVDEGLAKAVVALGQRDFSLALASEADALLKLAA